MDRIRELSAGSASTALVALMVIGCLCMWVAVPLGWLWIGSQVQSSASLSTALVVTMFGIVVSLGALVLALAWLNRLHLELRERRSRSTAGPSALEVILVTSAGIAVVGFVIWFLGFAGTSPLPVNVGF